MASSNTTPELNDGVTCNEGNLLPGHAVASSNVDDEAYNMEHSPRGHCIIFNHKHFDDSTHQRVRKGTDRDRDSMSRLFTEHGFKVDVRNDLTVNEIKRVLNDYSCLNHSDNDCFVIVFMSHGDNGQLFGRDGLFLSEDMFEKFTADKCPTLAGKPKMFFIQACQGHGLDPGTAMHKMETDGGNMNMYKILNQPDFLMCWSTVPGHAAWRDPNEGSWFMQSLDKVFTKCASSDDVLSMMTKVNCHMVQHFESNCPRIPEKHGMKQTASINSTLMRKIYLGQKTPVTFR